MENLGCEGGKKNYSALQVSSNWTKNQIDIRQINRKKIKLNFVRMGNPHRQGNSKDKQIEVYMSSWIKEKRVGV